MKLARIFRSRRSPEEVAQATRLCRSATRRPKWEGTACYLHARVLTKTVLDLPLGQWPSGTGGSPVLPRKYEISGLILLISLLSVSFLIHAAETSSSLPPETARLKPGPGSDLAVANCSLCHSADYISIQPRFTRAVWKAEVIKMQQKYGAPIATNNIDALADYLTANYGKEK